MGEHPQNAWLDDDGLRWYTDWDNIDHLSVTSQRKVLGMSYRLHAWVIRQLVDGIYHDLVTHRWTAPLLSEEDIKREMRQHATKKRDESANRGTLVHDFIAKGTRIDEVPAELQPYVAGYSRAIIELGIRGLLVERQVYNRKYRYAGSFDLLGEVRAFDNERSIIDLKTGSGTYIEHALQTLAYREAEVVANEKGTGVDARATEILRSTTGLGILHINPDLPKGYEYHRLKVTPKLMTAFKAQCVLSRFYATHKDIRELEA